MSLLYILWFLAIIGGTIVIWIPAYEIHRNPAKGLSYIYHTCLFAYTGSFSMLVFIAFQDKDFITQVVYAVRTFLSTYTPFHYFIGRIALEITCIQ
jgi:hypothetical protein